MTHQTSGAGKGDRLSTGFSGPNLTKALKERGITKWKLAKDLGISYRIVQYWEKGKYEPSQKNADRIADYLGMKRKVETIEAILARLEDHELRIHSIETKTFSAPLLAASPSGSGSPRKAKARGAGESPRAIHEEA